MPAASSTPKAAPAAPAPKAPPAIPVPDEIKKVAADRRVQVIAGVALLGLAIGFTIGLRLRGPQRWVPPVNRKQQPCPECLERATAAARVPVPVTTPVAPDVATTPGPIAGTPIPPPENGRPIGPQVIETPTGYSPYQDVTINE